MRALMLHELGEPEGLSLEEVSSPAPGPHQVLVDIYSAAVNFPDLLTIQGKYQLRPELPFAPGKEGAGVVAVSSRGTGS
jgi:NADPH2:quinone reductase